jgi:hypothetical protein
MLFTLESELPPDVFANGMRSALLFSGLVELDFSKIVDSPFYNTIPSSLRDTIAPVFRNKRYIPGRIGGSPWPIRTGATEIHLLRVPITIPDILTPNLDWLPNLRDFGSVLE